MRLIYLIIVVLLISTTLSATPSFSLSSEIEDPNTATTVTFTFSHTSFTNVEGFQFRFNFDNAIIDNPVLGSEAVGGIQKNVANNTEFNVLWASFPPTPTTLADGTLFTITFDIVGTTLPSCITISNEEVTIGGNPSTPTVMGGCLSSSVPVELMYFEAKKMENNQVQLNWATAAEWNNDRFEIEKSIDGDIFETIGSIEGQGDIAEFTYYSFEDKAPQIGSNYYRLKQIDKDGRFEYFEVQIVNIESITPKLVIFPTWITNNSTNINWESDQDEIQAHIFDVNGRLKRTIRLQKGKNQLNLSFLETGVYFIKAGNTPTIKIVKK